MKGSYEDSVWEHLAGTTNAPFEPGEHREIVVKAINNLGNESCWLLRSWMNWG
ncbi:hypothetical protein [Okeania sp. SIO2C9]|uniref:hypothetical protein n=1 Tax=Okeania sp. SIO2C9 TaxID=2607791 RepID=UPI0025D45142|nr:hypothetical protein [Okeania sp. SIO2C9]